MTNIRSLNRGKTILLANFIWILRIIVQYHLSSSYYEYHLKRGGYPADADSIMIPIFQECIGYVLLLFPINLLLAISLYKTLLPSDLLITAKRRTVGVIVWETCFATLLAFDIYLVISAIMHSFYYSLATYTTYIYIILTLRAGRINKINSELK